MGRLKQLEDENRRLKPLVLDLSLDRTMLQDVLRFWASRVSISRMRSTLALAIR
jgi:hypothetical protein